MKYFNRVSILILIVALGLFVLNMADNLARENLISKYVLVKTTFTNDNQYLISYLNEYEGEGISKIKFLNVGIWIKEDFNRFTNLKHELNPNECKEFALLISTALKDIGEDIQLSCE